MITQKKVMIAAFHADFESIVPALNIALGAISSNFDVTLLFAREATIVLGPDPTITPTKTREYLPDLLSSYQAPTIQELLTLIVEMGVQLLTIEGDIVYSIWPTQSKSIRTIMNDMQEVDLFLHF